MDPVFIETLLPSVCVARDTATKKGLETSIRPPLRGSNDVELMKG